MTAWCLLCVLRAPSVSAASPLKILPSPGCSPSEHELGERIVAAVAGSSNPPLRVELRLADDSGGTQLRLRLFSGLALIGSKQLVAASCAEVVEAAVAVVALALSSGTSPDAEGESADKPPARSPRTTAEARSEVRAVRPQAVRAEGPKPVPSATLGSDSGAVRARDERSDNAWLLAVGLEQGGVPGTAGIAELGVRVGLPAGELRATARYGAGTEQEYAEASALTGDAWDFAAVAFSYCYGVGQSLLIKGCGGLELDTVRHSWWFQDATTTADAEVLAASLRSTLGGVLAYRGAVVQPELLVSAGLLSAGGAAKTPRLGLRAALGAAVAF